MNVTGLAPGEDDLVELDRTLGVHDLFKDPLDLLVLLRDLGRAVGGAGGGVGLRLGVVVEVDVF